MENKFEKILHQWKDKDVQNSYETCSLSLITKEKETDT